MKQSNDLIFIYPRWRIDSAAAVQWLYLLAAVAVIITLWLSRRRIGRGPLTAVLFFAGTLFPALGFINVYPMRFSFVADHFQYLASIGLIVLMAGTLAHCAGRLCPPNRETRRALLVKYSSVVLAGIVIVTLSVLTWRRASVFHDMERLFRDTLAKNPASTVAHNHLGLILREQGRLPEALHHFRETQEHGPKDDPHHGVG